MMKFFRKYNKQMLAVFMSLLLMVWLGGSALESMFQPALDNEEVATLGGRPLRQSDFSRFEAEARLMSAIGLTDRMGRGWQSLATNFLDRTSAPKLLEPADWFLLRQEAFRFGLKVTDAQANEALGGMQPARLNDVRKRMQVSMDDIRNAIKDWIMVMRAAETATAVGHVTEPQLRLMARDTLEKVRVQYASLPVRSFLDATEEISDDEIASHFEARKNIPAGEGEGLGHGYQTPTQLVVQYVMADVSNLTADMTVTEEEARAYHIENKGLFRRPTPRRPRISLPPILARPIVIFRSQYCFKPMLSRIAAKALIPIWY